MTEYFSFLTNPSINVENPAGWFKRFSGALKVFFITWLLLILFGVFKLVIEHATGYTAPQRTDIGFMIRRGFASYAVLYWIVLLGPITEELIFRLSLTGYKEKYLRFSFALALSCFLVVQIRMGFWPNFQYGLQLFLFFLSMMLIAVVLYYLLSLINDFNISRFWERHFGVVVYLSALMFALLHLPAYRFEGVFIEKILAIILILIPYFIIGISLGYMRVRFGFLYAVFFHAVWNLIGAAAIFYRMSLV